MRQKPTQNRHNPPDFHPNRAGNHLALLGDRWNHCQLLALDDFRRNPNRMTILRTGPLAKSLIQNGFSPKYPQGGPDN